jgi:CubicO group peptidase (beta-lactamase class C family)
MALSPEALARLRARAQADVDAGIVPSCQYALGIGGEVVVAESLGAAPADARYSMWSCTKPVFASVVWQLMGEARLRPETRVVDLWPGFGRHGKDAVTLEHLLTFTAGFPAGALDPATISDRAARVEQMEQWTLDSTPGSEFSYHALSAHWVLAELVTRLTDLDHRVALRERVLDPLGLDRLELGVPADRQGDLQATVDTGEPTSAAELAEALGLPELPQPLADFVRDTAADTGVSPFSDLHAWQHPDVVAAGMPGAGAVSNAAGLAAFYQALLHDTKGQWEPSVLLDVTTNVRNTLAGPPLGALAMRTLGLEVQGDDPTSYWRVGGGAASPATFGHGGAGGQISWADPRTGLSFAYLTNGADRNVVRTQRRVVELSALAAACASRSGEPANLH